MLHHVTLQLARSKGYPEGSTRHGYEMTVPLDQQGRLSAAEWRNERCRCRVRRFWNGAIDRHGLLIHRPGGADGATWTIDYDPTRMFDDEAGYRLNQHRFAVGEYVSIQDEGGALHTFRVVEVRPIKHLEKLEEH